MQKWYEFKNIKDDVAEVYIYGEITPYKWEDTDVSAMEFKNELDSMNDKKLNIYINSPGGSVMEGQAISNMLKRYKGETNAYIDGMAASIASVIALSADNVYMPKNSYLMIHNAWTITAGNSKDLRAMADTLDKINEGIVEVYKAKSNVVEEVLKELMDKETWLTGNDVTKYFNINVIEEKKIAACITNNNNFKNMPKELIKEEPADEIVEDIEISNVLELAKARLSLRGNL